MRISHLHGFGLTEILRSIELPGTTAIHGLFPASTAVLLAQLRAVNRPIVIVGTDDEALRALEESLLFIRIRLRTAGTAPKRPPRFIVPQTNTQIIILYHL